MFVRDLDRNDEGMAALHSDGYQTATLWVLRANVRARRFYEQAEWSRDEATKVDHLAEVALDEVRYIKNLTPEM